MYRYSGCRFPYPHRITGDAYAQLMGANFDRPGPCDPEFRVKWTPENNEYFLELVEGGVPWTEIADIFHAIEGNLQFHYDYLVRTGQAKRVKRVAVRHRIPNECMEHVIAHLNERPIRQLAREIGYHHNTVTKKLHELGYKCVDPFSTIKVRWVKE